MGTGGAVSYAVLVTSVVCTLCWGTAWAARYRPDYGGPDRGSTAHQRGSDYDEYPPRRDNDYDRGHNGYDNYNTKPRRSRPSHGNSYNHGSSHSRPNRNNDNSEPSYRPKYDSYGSSNRDNNNYGNSDHGNSNYGNHNNRNRPSYDSYSSRSNRRTSKRRPDPYTDSYTRSRNRNSYSQVSHSRPQSSSHHAPSRRPDPYTDSYTPSRNRNRNSHSQVSNSRPQSSSHHAPSRRPSRASISHWYHPLSAYRQSYRRRDRGSRDRRGYYQASYNLGKNDYYSYKYPSIPKYDYSYSHDTSNYYGYKKRKISCYQCNYGPGKTTWKLVTVRKSVPDPDYPFRYMSVNARQYVRKEGVSAGWDKCQGALSRRSAAQHGVYQDATCEGSCYVRVDKNEMVYRGCYAGEWGVNPHMYGCGYQAGSLYCFCKGDRCNGFMAPNGYSDPYPVGYGERQDHPYPADYPRSSRYNPYPALRSYHRSHPVSSSRRRHRRHRRATGGDEVEEDDEETLAEDSAAVYKRLMGSNITGTSNVSGHTDETNIRRACYSCKAGGGCRNHFTDTQAAAALGVMTDTDCYGNCYVRLNANNGVSRGCYTGEMGLNQHLIGCHVQEADTYCFCRGNLCNNFAVTIVTPQKEAKVDKGIIVAKNVTKDNLKITKEKVTDLGSKLPKPQATEDYPMVLYYVEFPSDD